MTPTSSCWRESTPNTISLLPFPTPGYVFGPWPYTGPGSLAEVMVKWGDVTATVIRDDLELLALLCSPLRYWDYKTPPPSLVYVVLEPEPRASCIQDKHFTHGATSPACICLLNKEMISISAVTKDKYSLSLLSNCGTKFMGADFTKNDPCLWKESLFYRAEINYVEIFLGPRNL